MKTQFLSRLLKKYQSGIPLTMLTAYDYTAACCLEAAGIDMILVGDSLGNVFSGHDTTIPVTIEDMIYHTKAVKKGAPNSLIIVDMPFMSYRTRLDISKQNAAKIIQHTGANAVKCEVNTAEDVDTVKSLVLAGIPVMAHIGLTPQFVEHLGGFKKQGQSQEEQEAE